MRSIIKNILFSNLYNKSYCCTVSCIVLCVNNLVLVQPGFSPAKKFWGHLHVTNTWGLLQITPHFFTSHLPFHVFDFILLLLQQTNKPTYQTSPCCDTWLYFLNVYLYIPAEYRLIPNKWICYPCKYKHGARVRIMAGTPAHLPRTCQFGVFPPNPEPWHTNLCFCNSFSDLFSISISLNHPFHSHQLQHSVAILTVRYSRRKKHFYSLFGFPSTGTYFQQQGI